MNLIYQIMFGVFLGHMLYVVVTGIVEGIVDFIREKLK